MTKAQSFQSENALRKFKPVIIECLLGDSTAKNELSNYPTSKLTPLVSSPLQSNLYRSLCDLHEILAIYIQILPIDYGRKDPRFSVFFDIVRISIPITITLSVA